MFDLLIKNCLPYGMSSCMDIAIKEGRIVQIERNIASEAANECIDAANCFIAPGFVDSHMHWDKAFTMNTAESCNLDEAIRRFQDYCNALTKEELKCDIKNRAMRLARLAVANGTTSARSHANIDETTGMAGIEALNELKQELKDVIRLQITVLPNFPDRDASQYGFVELENVLNKGLADFVGGAPFFNSHAENEKILRCLFALAEKYALPIDLHVDESDAPDVHCLETVADLTLQYGFTGKVSCGHCTAMNAVDEATRNRVIEKCRKAKLNIISLPSCNLFLMGRNDAQPVRRGITTIREFMAAGVNVAFASDNVRDPFRPYGNGNMLEECLLTTQLIQASRISEFNDVYRMGTYNAAKAMILDGYGIEKGCRADLVIFDTPDLQETLLSQGTKRIVIFGGRVVSRTEKNTVSCIDATK